MANASKPPGPVRVRTRKAMDKGQVLAMIVYALRSAVVADQARRLLRPEHLDDEPHLRFLIEVLQDLLEAGDYRNGLVPYLTLYEGIRTRLNDDPDALGEDGKNWLLWRPPYTPVGFADGVLHYAYKTVKRRDLDDADGLELLRRFLRERMLSGPMRVVAEAVASGRVLDNYADIADDLRATSEKIEGISTAAGQGMRPPGGVVTPVVIIPTGVSFVDTPLDGGVADSEVYGVAGPTGGGKSTAMYQLGVSYAKLNPGRLVFHFSYEDPQERMNRRVWSYAARIRKDVLDKFKDPAQAVASGLFSSRETGLKPYELAMYRSLGRREEEMDGEYERLMAVWGGYDNYVMYDMLDAGRGEGGLDEIVSLIRRSTDEKGGDRRPGLVIIDSLDIVVKNAIAARGQSLKDYLRLDMIGFANQARRKIGVFGAATVLVNQIGGEHLKRSSGSKFSHADAGEAKGWANGLDLCLNFGNTDLLAGPDGDIRVTVLNCSKNRRTGHLGWYTTVRLAGDMGYWEDCGENYRVHQGSIVSTRDMEQLVDVGPAHPRKPQGSSAASATLPDWLP